MRMRLNSGRERTKAKAGRVPDYNKENDDPRAIFPDTWMSKVSIRRMGAVSIGRITWNERGRGAGEKGRLWFAVARLTGGLYSIRRRNSR